MTHLRTGEIWSRRVITLPQWRAMVAEHGCVICGSPEVQLHHLRGGSAADAGILSGLARKSSDWLILPLAARFHTGKEGIHVIGVRSWEGLYGTQISLYSVVCEQLGIDGWKRMSNAEATQKANC